MARDEMRRAPSSRPPADLWARLAASQDRALEEWAARDASVATIVPGEDVVAGEDRVWRARRDLAAARVSSSTSSSSPTSRAGARSIAVGIACAAVAVVLIGVIGFAIRGRARRVANGGVVATRGAPSTHASAAKFRDVSVAAQSRTDLPLDFADGSRIVFAAGSTGRARALGGSGEEVFLEHGRLDVHVIHSSETLWLVHAGPYRVRVTGTRFAVTWSPDGPPSRFELALFEGSVVIDGALLGAGIPLGAGQRLQVTGDVVLLEPLATAAAQEIAGPESSPDLASPHQPEQKEPQSDSAADRWLALSERGAYGAAFAEARRAGWDALCHQLDATRLLTLADLARYARAPSHARRAFTALVTRFPADPLASDAVFSLGRLAFESGKIEEAADWFHRYVVEWPHAALAGQAAARWLESAAALGDGRASRVAARAYLRRADHGPDTALARDILSRSDEPEGE